MVQRQRGRAGAVEGSKLRLEPDCHPEELSDLEQVAEPRPTGAFPTSEHQG